MSEKEQEQSFASLPASGAAVIHGPYGEVAKAIGELERSLPPSVRLVYRRFSPGRLTVTSEE